MAKELLTPDYIFEASWEVCNKVGEFIRCCPPGPNTAGSIQRQSLFIGPDFWAGKENPLFSEMKIFVRHGVNML